NVEGKVIMYADRVTDSMRRAIGETERRRKKQLEYNQIHGITPETVRKTVRDLIIVENAAEEKIHYELEQHPNLSRAEIKQKIADLETAMLKAATELEFEKAAELRDEMHRWEKLIKEDLE
ncbi:MAG TPA: UvrB/UvrC motif-containing protein, partial [Bacillota bacterium]|nr:UvrB/UvrC motif-containing protein [Bacillota bacterium]